jgi:hypothetical protein
MTALRYATTVTRGRDGQLYLEHVCEACDWPVLTADLCAHAVSHMPALRLVSETACDSEGGEQ